MPDTTTPRRGNNEPADDNELLIERAADLVKTSDKWTVVADANQAARLGDFLVQLRQGRDDLEAAENKLKAPLAQAIERIRERFRLPRQGIGLAIARIKALSDDWLKRETDRKIDEKAEADRRAELARQEAERKADLATKSGKVGDAVAARAAIEKAEELEDQASGMSTKATIRGDLSGKAISARTTWSAEISDPKAARKHYARHAEILSALDEAIVKVATRQARLDKDEKRAPPGIRYLKVRSVA